MATYFALTTLNAQMSGWRVVAQADTRTEAEKQGKAWVDSQRAGQTDLYWQTYDRNLTVLSKTRAIRGGYLSQWAIDEGEVWSDIRDAAEDMANARQIAADFAAMEPLGDNR